MVCYKIESQIELYMKCYEHKMQVVKHVKNLTGFLKAHMKPFAFCCHINYVKCFCERKQFIILSLFLRKFIDRQNVTETL